MMSTHWSRAVLRIGLTILAALLLVAAATSLVHARSAKDWRADYEQATGKEVYERILAFLDKHLKAESVAASLPSPTSP